MKSKNTTVSYSWEEICRYLISHKPEWIKEARSASASALLYWWSSHSGHYLQYCDLNLGGCRQAVFVSGFRGLYTVHGGKTGEYRFYADPELAAQEAMNRIACQGRNPVKTVFADFCRLSVEDAGNLNRKVAGPCDIVMNSPGLVDFNCENRLNTDDILVIVRADGDRLFGDVLEDKENEGGATGADLSQSWYEKLKPVFNRAMNTVRQHTDDYDTYQIRNTFSVLENEIVRRRAEVIRARPQGKLTPNWKIEDDLKRHFATLDRFFAHLWSKNLSDERAVVPAYKLLLWQGTVYHLTNPGRWQEESRRLLKMLEAGGFTVKSLSEIRSGWPPDAVNWICSNTDWRTFADCDEETRRILDDAAKFLFSLETFLEPDVISEVCGQRCWEEIQDDPDVWFGG